jgi:two-component system cell cycle sensor histidine kinase/response regulator CckA
MPDRPTDPFQPDAVPEGRDQEVRDAAAVGDATAREQAEAALRESEGKYRALFEGAPMGILVADVETRAFSVANPAICRMLGYDEADLLRLRVNDIHPADQLQHVVDEFDAQARGMKTLAPDLLCLRKDGSVFVADISSTTVEIGGRTTLIRFFRDTTDRRRAEEDSRERQRLLDRIVNASPDLIYVYDLSERHNVYANQETLVFLGYDADRITSDVGSLMENIAHPDDLPRLLAHHANCTTAGDDDVLELEYRLRDAAGRWRWMRSRDSVFTRDAEGRARQILGLAEDVSDRRAAEHDLRESHRFLEASQRAARLGWYSLDVTTGRWRSSSLLDEIFGITGPGFERDVAGWLKIIHPEDQQDMLDYLQHHVLGGRHAFDRQYRIVRLNDAEQRWVHGRGELAFDANGAPVTMLGVIQDITERKRAEEELRLSRQWMDLHVQQTPLAVIEFDLEGRVREWNPAAVNMFGFARDEAVGQHWTFMVPEAVRPSLDGVWVTLVSQRGGTRSTNDNCTKSGEIIACEWFSTPLIDQDGKTIGVASLVMDVTARKQAEAERARLEEQVRQAVKMESIGRLAGGVAHDFNNMLQAILGNVDLALGEAPTGSAVTEYLGEIRRSAERSADLTRQLLAFARKQTIRPRILDLNDTVAGMLKMLRRLIGENIQLLWSPGVDVWPVKVDPGQIDQILANLTVNARDAIDGGGRVTIETANITLDGSDVRTRTECLPGDYVALKVSDTGRGLDDEARAHMFEPFFTTKEQGKGTGLGLATVFGIVTQNNGFIDAISEPGRGTTFTIYLPRAEALALTDAPRSDEPSIGGTETVLLVEDEEQVLKLGRLILERSGYTVMAARTPAAGLALAATVPGRLHVLVTDVVMPGMNGKDLLDRLRPDHPGLKCLFMSGYTSDVIAPHGILDEGIQFLQKPFTAATLAARVRDVLGRNEPR